MLHILTTLFAGRGQSDNVWVYMDDIICGEKFWGQNLRNLGTMLKILQDNNLTCNHSKRNFCFSEIEYLGHRISSKGIRIWKKLKQLEILTP